MTSLLVPPNVQPNVVPLELASLTVLPEPMTIEEFYEFCRCQFDRQMRPGFQPIDGIA
jgi:hypothetical protein